MNKYIGTKIVKAGLCEAHEFALKHGKQPGVVPEVGSDGHSQPGYVVVYEDGYTSWSPRDVFERCYRPITGAEYKLITEE